MKVKLMSASDLRSLEQQINLMAERKYELLGPVTAVQVGHSSNIKEYVATMVNNEPEIDPRKDPKRLPPIFSKY